MLMFLFVLLRFKGRKVEEQKKKRWTCVNLPLRDIPRSKSQSSNQMAKSIKDQRRQPFSRGTPRGARANILTRWWNPKTNQQRQLFSGGQPIQHLSSHYIITPSVS